MIAADSAAIGDARATEREEGMTDEEKTVEAPATDPPGDKIYICPACGTRYDEPTTCSNGHEPTETVEYDRATVEAADAGDADAIASVNEQAVAAGNTTAGVPTQSREAVPDSSTAVPPVPTGDAPAASGDAAASDAAAASDVPPGQMGALVPAAPDATTCDVSVTVNGVTYAGTISAG